MTRRESQAPSKRTTVGVRELQAATTGADEFADEFQSQGCVAAEDTVSIREPNPGRAPRRGLIRIKSGGIA
jgi:hypothetical protein